MDKQITLNMLEGIRIKGEILEMLIREKGELDPEGKAAQLLAAFIRSEAQWLEKLLG